MKYISEERFNEVMDKYGSCSVTELLDEFSELEQLTVTKLRPMSEAPIDKDVLGYHKHRTEFIKIFKCEDGDFYFSEDDMHYGEEDFIGWIPLPQYKPEE